jgi:hypothetical protein
MLEEELTSASIIDTTTFHLMSAIDAKSRFP